MFKKFVFLILAICFFTTSAFTQPGRFHPTEEQKKIFMQLRDLELLKTLDLDEDESVRVLPIIKDLDNAMHDFFKKNRDYMEDLQSAIDNKDPKKISKILDKLIVIEEEYHSKKAALHKKLVDELGEVKFAQYLLFMQSFGRDLQNKIKTMREGDKLPEKHMDNRNK